MVKKCSKCGIEKDIVFFHKEKKIKTGFSNICKKCKSIKDKQYREKNKEKIRIKKKEYSIKNKNIIKAYNIKNKEKRKKNYQLWVSLNKEKVKQYNLEYKKNRRKVDFNFKMIYVLNKRIGNALKNKNIIKSTRTLELLGCDLQTLKKHLESQFTVGMSWSNYGFYGWHIDHIRPCASFDLSDPEQQKACFHYTNLQPLWAEENLKKGAKIA